MDEPTLTFYAWYKGERPAFLERGAVVFIESDAVMRTCYSRMALCDFHTLQVRVPFRQVYNVSGKAYCLLDRAATFESEEYT